MDACSPSLGFWLFVGNTSAITRCFGELVSAHGLASALSVLREYLAIVSPEGVRREILALDFVEAALSLLEHPDDVAVVEGGRVTYLGRRYLFYVLVKLGVRPSRVGGWPGERIQWDWAELISAKTGVEKSEVMRAVEELAGRRVRVGGLGDTLILKVTRRKPRDRQ